MSVARRTSRFARRLRTGAILLLALACDQATEPEPVVPVYSVDVTPPTAQLTEGETVQLSAVVRDQAGNPLTGRSVTWASDNTPVALVSSTGLVRAVGAGQAVISATSEGQNATATINVRAVVASVVVAPATASINIGQTVSLTATSRDAAGSPLTGRSVTWSTSSSTIATVANGVVTGVGEGTATITATVEGRTGSAEVSVTRVPVASVAVSPASGALAPGQTLQLTAEARDASGRSLSGRQFSWSSSSDAVATVSADGLVTAVAPGTATITVTSEGRSTTATITVRAPVASVTLNPNSASLVTGQTATLSATLRDAAGNVLTGREISWTTSDASVATVSASGVVRAVGPGSATITATSEGQSAMATVTVARPAVASVTVSPSSRTILRGASTTLSATVRDAAGNTLTDRTVTWSSSNNAVASVSPSGTVTGVGAGTATITATSEGVTGSATVTVTPPPDPTVTVVIRNQLLAPINISVNNGQATGSVPAGDTRQVTVQASRIEVSWSVVQQFGDAMSGRFDPVTNPPDRLDYTVDNVVGNVVYFAPVMTNTTAQDWLMGVNMGLQSENRCNCLVLAGRSNVFLGYYRLFTNTNVRAYLRSNGYAGEYWFWNVSSAPRGSGRVNLIR